jgi:transposase InsO family protein
LATEKEISITAVCRQLGYSKQAYYKTKSNQQKKLCYRNIAKQKVVEVRKQLSRIGTRKLYYLLEKEFKQEQIPVGRDKLFSILRDEQLLIIKKKRYTKTTNSKHWLHKYPNLVKGLSVMRPEQVWVADITYIGIENGFAYLHLITDAYSKQIMGYCVSKDLAATATIKALQMALLKRKYKGSLIHHSDRGLQYCSAGYVKLLEQNKVAISMTQDGNPYDNAIAERVNGVLKDEFGLYDTFKDLQQAQKQIEQSISVYNGKRPHLSCQMLTPEQMHSQTKLKIKTWAKKNHKNFGGSCDFLPLIQHL